MLHIILVARAEAKRHTLNPCLFVISNALVRVDSVVCDGLEHIGGEQGKG